MELRFDKKIFKEMLGFSSWTFIGSSSAILKDQGVNIIINIFFNTALNAARALSTQVNTAVYGFAQNFMLAVNPQIIKSYATGHVGEMFDLAFKSSRLAYYLLLCLSTPIIVAMPFVLGLWLTIIPPYTISFTRLTLILGMFEVISLPLQYMNQASGKIKVYQLTVGGIQMLNFPLAYILLRNHFSPDSVYVLAIVLSQVCLGARLFILRRSIDLPVKRFLFEVYGKIMVVTIICGILVSLLFYFEEYRGWNPILVFSLSLLFTLSICYCIGLNSGERQWLSTKLLDLYQKFSHGNK